MVRRLTLLVVLAIVSLTACSAAPEERLNAYLRAVAGAEADRGWHYLAETTREVGYANEKSPYLADAAAADWEELRWSPATVQMSDDGFSFVMVRLLSPPSSVPAFLIARGLLNGVCEGDSFEPIGLGLIVSDRFPGEAQIGGGGLTGSQLTCNRRFIGSAADDLSQ